MLRTGIRKPGQLAGLATTLVAALACPSFASAAAQPSDVASSPALSDRAALAAWREEGFPTSTPDRTLLALADMMTADDPFLRDEIGFAGLSAILRRDAVDRATLTMLVDTFTKRLSAPDERGVVRPFAVLGLAEVARVDRISTFLDDAEFDGLVATSVGFLEEVEDYRGYDAELGWRHSVAHSADLILQLALNPRTSSDQLQRMADAIASQVSPAEPYVHGEPRRLARALLYIARHANAAGLDWPDMLDQMTADVPRREDARGEALLDQLARQHNLRAFLLEVYAVAVSSQDRRLEPLGNAALEQLAKL